MATDKSICSIDGCDGVSVARGWCRPHYNRWHYAGTTDGLNSSVVDGCLRCGGAIPPKGRTGPTPSYCSRACRSAVGYDRAKVSGAYQRQLANQRKQPIETTCEQCGKRSVTVRPARFCSSVCANRFGDLHGAPCEVAGCERGVRAKGVCNTHYRRMLRAEGRLAEPWDERRRANWHKRRARMRGAYVEDVRLDVVAARDGYVCGICKDPVDRSICWPDPFSSSLDHVMPLARGGTHSYDNCQLAHLRCNTSKGARVA